MATGKVVILTRGMNPELLDAFMAEKPAGWQVSLVNPDNDDQKVAKELEDAQYLLPMYGPVMPKILQMAKQLKLIQTWGQGTDHLPVNWALRKGIAVANSGGANAIAVAEHTVLLILACLRKFILFNQSTRDGKFRPYIGRDSLNQLYDKTVGIVGFGSIGRWVAKLCYGFGANIIYSKRTFVPYVLRADFKARPVSLDELLSISDIVTLHIPALASNRELIGWNQLIKMKPSAYIINTSRGTIIDEVALLRALNEKKIAGAGLDVWNPEPPDPKNPLLQMPNVVATPHYAGSAIENRKWAYEAIWRNILLVSEGKEPLNSIHEF
ncbi:MAG: 2-hydroxyacid dehydrogenase [Dehalococcoidales bacterium]|nr:2-hydroxyacid dehydrogenase [Dehalococcoidales bacterium]